MEKLHGVMAKILFGCFLLAMLAVVAPQPALAFQLDVFNGYDEKMYFAVEEFDDNDGWRVHGWWSVEPNAHKKINFSNSTGADSLYIWGHVGKKTLDAPDRSNNGNFTYRPTIGDKFNYLDVQGPKYLNVNYNPPCPQGRNFGWHFFTRVPIEDGMAYWCPGD